MKMNRLSIISVLAAMLFVASCTDSSTDDVKFSLDRETIDVGTAGGDFDLKILSGDDWIATTDEVWITVSPANGKGSAECKLLIDSALTSSPRQGVVRIQNQNTWENREITITQSGYDYALTLDNTNVEVANYADFGKRYFDVEVMTNVDFDIEIPEEAQKWLGYDKYSVTLDRGIRPRSVKVRFNWSVNTRPDMREAAVEFVAKKSVDMARCDVLKVCQEPAEEIVEGRAGDSIALLAVQRALNCWYSWDTTLPMDEWDDVALWRKGQDGYTPEKEGRVRYVRFYAFGTKEPIPFEVQYLTAADEIAFFGNTNTFMLDLDTGEYITKLTQLRRLTIGAYGLVSLHEDFTNLSNLEYLNLGSNNFQSIPREINPTNFPKLRTLIMNANQRNAIHDLSNTIRTNYGGLSDEDGFPERLFEFDLDTLVLSVNYLQGELPTMEHADKYTEADIIAADTLPMALKGIPKIMPNAKMFAINHNRFYGNIPDWLLYHPALDWWLPYSFIFPQEGKTTEGQMAGFSNEPTSLGYYYDFYKGFKVAPSDDEIVEE